MTLSTITLLILLSMTIGPFLLAFVVDAIDAIGRKITLEIRYARTALALASVAIFDGPGLISRANRASAKEILTEEGFEIVDTLLDVDISLFCIETLYHTLLDDDMRSRCTIGELEDALSAVCTDSYPLLSDEKYSEVEREAARESFLKGNYEFFTYFQKRTDLEEYLGNLCKSELWGLLEDYVILGVGRGVFLDDKEGSYYFTFEIADILDDYNTEERISDHLIAEIKGSYEMIGLLDSECIREGRSVKEYKEFLRDQKILVERIYVEIDELLALRDSLK